VRLTRSIETEDLGCDLAAADDRIRGRRHQEEPRRQQRHKERQHDVGRTLQSPAATPVRGLALLRPFREGKSGGEHQSELQHPLERMVEHVVTEFVVQRQPHHSEDELTNLSMTADLRENAHGKGALPMSAARGCTANIKRA
jgi:hypothetical protein